jgi:hypothetical protein
MSSSNVPHDKTQPPAWKIKRSGVDIDQLERDVRLAELRMRQVEAEVRYIKAVAERKALKSAKRQGKNDQDEE